MRRKGKVIFSQGFFVALLSLLALPVSALSPTEVAKLLSGDTSDFPLFGTDVAIDGDTALISARPSDINFDGAAYVFTRSGGVWTQQAKLTSDGATDRDQFGSGIALSGDTALVGSSGDGVNNHGAVYVFTRSAGIWTLQTKLAASDGASSDAFGFAVALNGDTALVGAHGDDGNGSAYVFTRSMGAWAEQTKLTASDGAASDFFGRAVALSSDTALIAAMGDDDNGTNSGSAYLFTHSAGIWTQQAKITSSDGAINDFFGRSVALDGDTALIGAQQADCITSGIAFSDCGAAYVFTRSAGTWSEQAKLSSIDNSPQIDQFGSSVAVDGDIALIGARNNNEPILVRSGSAYVFTRTAGIWMEQARLDDINGQANDNFGGSVALDGDTALVGAPRDDVNGDDSANGDDSGSVFVYSLGIGPVSNAGPDQTKDEGLLITLDGSASTNASNYSWAQIAGPTVSLSSMTVVNPDFTAPYVDTNTTLNFQLIVDDGQGNFSDPDTVNITLVSVNNPPVSDAGDDATIKEGAVATLDGSNSFDPEGDTPLGFNWTQTTGPLVALSSNLAVSPTFTAPLGIGNVLTFELVVDDGKEFSTADTVVITVVENSQPVANAGPNQTVDEGSPVNLDGTASNDPDGGDSITFNWSEPVTLNDDNSPTPSFTAPFAYPGGEVLTFDLVVTDDDPIKPKSSNPDQVVINVRNINDPPSCDLARAVCQGSKIKGNDSCLLWPPNHKLISVDIDGVMDADAQYNSVTLQITGVTQDEPVNSGGDGDTSPDAIIQTGHPMDSVLIRSERTGLHGAQENGRVYVVSFTASDGFESCTGSVSVGVPHDRKDTPVNDGQIVDSTQP